MANDTNLPLDDIESDDSTTPEGEEPEEEHIMLLTRNEALFIDDSLSMIIERAAGEERLVTVRPLTHSAGLAAPLDLLEKIGFAILFTTDPENNGEPAEVSFSDTDLYMLREISASYVKVGDEPVGFNLKRKIYSLLYQQSYEQDKVAKRLLGQVNFTQQPIEESINVETDP